jgi:hypothetical protein
VGEVVRKVLVGGQELCGRRTGRMWKVTERVLLEVETKAAEGEQKGCGRWEREDLVEKQVK